MLSLRSPRRNPLVQVVARVLILALVTMMVPLEAGASIPASTENLTKSAFGELLAHTGSDPQPYAFTGEPLDPNSGFQYHRARWMDPGVGRFAGMDPFEGRDHDPVSLHRYLYAGADPSGKVDPSGRDFGLVSSLSATYIATTIMGAQATVGLAVIDQAIYGGSAGLESIVIGGAIGVAAGAAIYGISKLGLRLLHTTGFQRFLSRVFQARGVRPNVGLYGEIAGTMSGLQANHLNQNAAFASVIPRNAGAAVGMRGNAFVDRGAPHFEFHRALDDWWEQFRRGGSRFGTTPTCSEYDDGLRQALRSSGFTEDVTDSLALYARQNRNQFGLLDSTPVPRIPGRTTPRSQ